MDIEEFYSADNQTHVRLIRINQPDKQMNILFRFFVFILRKKKT